MVPNGTGSASMKIMGFLLFLLLAMDTPSAAADAQGPLLTFDKREHRAMPDISTVPRVRFLTTLDFPPFEFLDAEAGCQVSMLISRVSYATPWKSRRNVRSRRFPSTNCRPRLKTATAMRSLPDRCDAGVAGKIRFFAAIPATVRAFSRVEEDGG